MSNEVRDWRESLGLTQDEAARRLGITTRNLQAYEAGSYAPPVTVRMLMTAAANGISLDPWPIDSGAEK